MKMYRSDQVKIAWYKRIDWLRLIVSILLLFIFFTLGFNWLAKNTDLARAIRTSMLISLIIGVNLVLRDLFSNKNIVLFNNKDSIKYIDLQNDMSGRFISDLDYNDIIEEYNPKEVYEHIDKHVGIVAGEIIKINTLKERVNCLIIKAKVKEKKWKQLGFFFAKDAILKEKEYNKKIIVKKDIEKYDEVKKMLLKKKQS
jgi:hypothetical protein